MYKLFLAGIFITGIAILQACSAKHRNCNRTEPVSETEDTVSKPPLVSNAADKALVGKWILVSSKKKGVGLLYPQTLFNVIIDRFEFTGQKACTFSVGNDKRIAPFMAHSKTIYFQIREHRPPEEYFYTVKDSLLTFHLEDQTGKPLDLNYIRTTE